MRLIGCASASKVVAMSGDAPQKIDLNALRDKSAAIKTALNELLTQHSLTLSPQNYERAFQHLLSCMHDYESVSAADVRGYLNEVLEYHEHNIAMMNKTGIAEDSLVKILITADDHVPVENVIAHAGKPWKLTWRSLPMPVAVSIVLLIGASFAGPRIFNEQPVQVQDSGLISADTRVITSAEEEELRTLVHGLSAESGDTHIKIYNRIKALPEITKYGYAPTYKKFNHAQFLEAKIWLERETGNFQNVGPIGPASAP